ncbi:MAG: hypothetical protein AAGF26_14575 [Cyanobacteria bacterium P01_G01_bin.49]
MEINQQVRCSNCGHYAQRRYYSSDEATGTTYPDRQVIQTECSHCDYLMVIYFHNAQVVEVYAPGISRTIHPKIVHELTPKLEQVIFSKAIA